MTKLRRLLYLVLCARAGDLSALAREEVGAAHTKNAAPAERRFRRR